jgi:hypothetical protein
MDELLETLPQRDYTDIAIRPFQLVDDVLFGLAIEQGHGDREDVEEPPTAA